jgi:hypothetical protein
MNMIAKQVREFAMRRMMFGVAGAVVLAGGVQAQEIGGTYAVQGTNLDGTAYGGTAVITVDSDTTCSIEWTTGDLSYVGICMNLGSVVAAAYVPAEGEGAGLQLYEVLESGVLEGVWTVAGQPGVGTEVLTPQ